VSIEIGVLSVQGMNARQADTLGSVFQAEFGRLIEMRGLPRGLANPGAQRVIELEGPRGIHAPSKLAAMLAESLYRRLDA